MKKFLFATAAAITAMASPAQAANVIPGNWLLLQTNGYYGELRAGSGWESGSTPSEIIAATDGVLAPTSQQWNNGSYWIDKFSPNNAQAIFDPYYLVILNSTRTLNRLLVQADDNDNYQVAYWNGSAWQDVFNAGAVGGWGLQTRDSGIITPFTTDRLRVTMTGGDGYYALSELQAFEGGAVPEPATWAFMIVGFGAVGGAMRRKTRTYAKVSFA